MLAKLANERKAFIVESLRTVAKELLIVVVVKNARNALKSRERGENPISVTHDTANQEIITYIAPIVTLVISIARVVDTVTCDTCPSMWTLTVNVLNVRNMVHFKDGSIAI